MKKCEWCFSDKFFDLGNGKMVCQNCRLLYVDGKGKEFVTKQKIAKMKKI